MRLTDQQIEAGKSPRGGFTRKQLAAWGVPWPPVQGWRTALLAGRPIPKRRSGGGRKKMNRDQPAKITVAGCDRDLARLEDHVYRLAAFLIERGHHDAAEALAGDARGAALYLAGPMTTNCEAERFEGAQRS